jgi:hypothetical protein
MVKVRVFSNLLLPSVSMGTFLILDSVSDPDLQNSYFLAYEPLILV